MAWTYGYYQRPGHQKIWHIAIGKAFEHLKTLCDRYAASELRRGGGR